MSAAEVQLAEARAELQRVRIIALMLGGMVLASLGPGHYVMPWVKEWMESLGVEWRYGPVGPPEARR